MSNSIKVRKQASLTCSKLLSRLLLSSVLKRESAEPQRAAGEERHPRGTACCCFARTKSQAAAEAVHAIHPPMMMTVQQNRVGKDIRLRLLERAYGGVHGAGQRGRVALRPRAVRELRQCAAGEQHAGHLAIPGPEHAIRDRR